MEIIHVQWSFSGFNASSHLIMQILVRERNWPQYSTKPNIGCSTFQFLKHNLCNKTGRHADRHVEVSITLEYEQFTLVGNKLNCVC